MFTRFPKLFQITFSIALSGMIAASTSAAALAQSAPPVPRERPENLSAPANNPNESREDVEQAPGTIEEIIEPTAEIVAAPVTTSAQPVTLIARISEDGAIIPDGLTWRVFDTKPNAEGQLDVIARSTDATALVSLPPAEYLVHVAYGNAQVSDTLLVEPGPNEKTIIMDAGALKLNSSISGDLPITSSTLTYDIYTTGTDGQRIAVLRDVRQNRLVHLNAGIYSVESHWGSVNATVRADLRVESGQITEATLFHKASLTNLKLVSSVGGEAIADVDWSITDSQGFEVFTFTGAFPSLVLAEGEYTVLAKQGANVYNRDFDVKAGEPREIEVLTEVY